MSTTKIHLSLIDQQFNSGFPAASSFVNPKEQNESYQILVGLLKEAAHLEHCLLNSYLYTACSIKSTLDEFEISDKPDDNVRAGIQFERAREWKRNILFVAHEEMLHLHYVQCMLRALGERPCFTLPERDTLSSGWFIPNWRARLGTKECEGVSIPLGPLTEEKIKSFILYESTDALQVQDPFGKTTMELFEDLFKFEVMYNIQASLLNVEDESTRRELSDKLWKLYTEQPLRSTEPPATLPSQYALPTPPPWEKIQFASIADFYRKAVAPLYQQAFRNGWVININRDLVNEIQSSDYAQEGFLPIGPVYRSHNFENIYEQNISSYYRDFKSVDQIIDEIVEEGEGFQNFEARSLRLLKEVKDIGERQYVKYCLQEKASGTETPSWFVDCQMLRKSHLYKFVMIMMGMKQEEKLAKVYNVKFSPSREPVTLDDDVGLTELEKQLPYQFNACYLVMIMWLSRMYEVTHWASDKSRRQAIEMLASWPLMSLGIRPFLELISFFRVENFKLFSLEADHLPRLPWHAQQLFQLYMAAERSEEINCNLDYFGVKTLSDVSTWASEKISSVNTSTLPSNQKQMILTRLEALVVLNKFEAQFSFRLHGGYSNRLPDLTYRRDHPNSGRYEENPQKAIYENTLLLRLRFSGWGLVQLATDPDPPNDEAGCTGTIMLQPSDGEGKRLNRALIWQRHTNDSSEIKRGPKDAVPEIGVNCVDISLMAAGTNVKVGYIPLHTMNSVGAVQTTGVQSILDIVNLAELCRFKPEDITDDPEKMVRIDLLSKGEFKPLLLGENHLIWQDGEPIDPFILQVSIDGDVSENQEHATFKREIYNEDKRLIEMTPYERLLSARGPVGFDSVTNVPKWARPKCLTSRSAFIGKSRYPASYLVARAQELEKELKLAFGDSKKLLTNKDVKDIASLASRMNWMALDPRGTINAWLKVLLHYGHSISGSFESTDKNPILEIIRQKTGLSCTIDGSKDRNEKNARWIIKYCKGIMDVDALSDFIFGELYIPVTITSGLCQEIKLCHDWKFNEQMYGPLKNFTIDFYKVFWRDDYEYDRKTKTRTIKISETQTLTEQVSQDNEHRADTTKSI